MLRLPEVPEIVFGMRRLRHGDARLLLASGSCTGCVGLVSSISSRYTVKKYPFIRAEPVPLKCGKLAAKMSVDMRTFFTARSIRTMWLAFDDETREKCEAAATDIRLQFAAKSWRLHDPRTASATN